MIKIGDKIIGGESTFIIADIGSNHMQDLSIAKKTVLAAVEAGVDAVKFQSIQLDSLYHKPDSETEKFIKQLEFPEFWHKELNDYCKTLKVPFFSSPTYLESIDILEEINVPLYKIASAQIGVFPQLVDRVASLNKPTIFSTGIVNNEELDAIVNVFEKHQNEKFIILHCNSIYPTPPDKVNLPMIGHYLKKYPNQPIGFSDHTVGTHIAKAAVALGANVIEKHFTLDKNFDAPDSNEFACDPKEMELLCKEIREIEFARAKYSNRRFIEPQEKQFKNVIQYRCLAKKSLKAGELVKEQDFYYLRAENGLTATDLKKSLKARLYYANNIKHKQLLRREDIQW